MFLNFNYFYILDFAVVKFSLNSRNPILNSNSDSINIFEINKNKVFIYFKCLKNFILFILENIPRN